MSIRRTGLVLGIFLGFGLGTEAMATRGASQRPVVRRMQVRLSPMRQQNNTALTSAGHLSKVRARTRLLSRWVTDGEPDANGSDEVYFHAAFAELLPVQGVSQRETVPLSYGDNGSHTNDTSQRIRVSGIGSDGIYRGHLIGTTSVHDLLPSAKNPSDADWKAMDRAIQARIGADYIRVSYDYGPGTRKTVIADKVKSQAATAIPIQIPLNKKGLTRVIYDRTNSSGQVVGSSGMYVGRIVEIDWKQAQ